MEFNGIILPTTEDCLKRVSSEYEKNGLSYNPVSGELNGYSKNSDKATFIRKYLRLLANANGWQIVERMNEKSGRMYLHHVVVKGLTTDTFNLIAEDLSNKYGEQIATYSKKSN